MVVPCGMEAMRVTVSPSCGMVVRGNMNPNAGLEVDADTLAVDRNVVDALHIRHAVEEGVWLRPVPRFGTEPRLFENERVSEVRFSSRMLSLEEGAVELDSGVSSE
jgi:hypothetical protein